MNDNIRACSHNHCCSGNATMLCVVCVELCHYQWHTCRSIYSCTMLLWQILCHGQKYSVCSSRRVTYADWNKSVHLLMALFGQTIWLNR